MRLLLLLLLVFVTLVAGTGLYLFYRVKRWANSTKGNDLVESFDAGLAIPMRDSDTRPRR